MGNKIHVLELLRHSKPELQASFGVTNLALFGRAGVSRSKVLVRAAESYPA